jgi:hypothetical protein
MPVRYNNKKYIHTLSEQRHHDNELVHRVVLNGLEFEHKCLNRRPDKVDRFIQDELVADDGRTTII